MCKGFHEKTKSFWYEEIKIGSWITLEVQKGWQEGLKSKIKAKEREVIKEDS